MESLFSGTICVAYLLTINLQVVTQSVVLKTKDIMDKESYDDEPVYYCKRCLSLKICQVPMVENQSYCEDCGTVDIGEASFEEWDAMYVQKYGHHYLVKEEKRKWPYWC